MKPIPWIILLFLSISSVGWCQELIPLGTWRNHLAFNRARFVEFAGDKTFCISENGVFYLDETDNGIYPLSKINGLNGTGISAAGYDGTGRIVFGYRNGNVDLLEDGKIINFPGLVKSSLIFPKEIREIHFYGGNILLTADFGMVILDPELMLARETWSHLGRNGEFVSLFCSLIYKDTLYVGTSEGLISCSLDPAVNQSDFNNWTRYSADQGLPEIRINALADFNNRIFVLQDHRYIYSGIKENWNRIKDYDTLTVETINASADFLYITLENSVEKLNRDGDFFSVPVPDRGHPVHFTADQNGMEWLSDEKFGFFYGSNGQYENILPNGPYFNNAGKTKFLNNGTVLLPSNALNYRPQDKQEGFGVFSMGEWHQFLNNGFEIPVGNLIVSDIVDTDYDQQENKYLLATLDQGIVMWDESNQFRVIDANTPGTLLNFDSEYEGKTMVSSVWTDQTGYYLCNYSTPDPLKWVDRSGAWTEFDPGAYSAYAVQLLRNLSGEILMRINPVYNQGIHIFSTLTGLSRILTDENNEGALPSKTIYDMEFDRTGYLWFATEKGVAYLPDPENMLGGRDLNAIIPVFDGRFLLKDEKINCLSVDGGNNKWIGTDRGLWLFNDDGSRLIQRFDVTNSPLLSDSIVDLSVNQSTGEVFISTSRGLISYRGQAIADGQNEPSLVIYPNPVPPGFTGLVGIKGLADESVVKITDVSGKLIYETRSEGGQAVWDTRNLQGNKVTTGVYLVFISNKDGEEGLSGKIAVIH